MRSRTAALCAVAILAAAAAEARAVKTFRKVLPVEVNGRVLVDGHNGSVTVVAWNQPNVSIDARIEESSHSGEAEDVEKTDIKVTGSRSFVRIESDYTNVPSHSWLFGMGSTRSLPPVHYVIRIPATAHLEVSVHNATVKAEGMSRSVDIETHNGSIALTSFTGTAELETHNGSVSLAYARYSSPARIETHNGSVDILVPPDARMSITADAHNRYPVSSELPLAIRSGGSNYTAALNGGGPELRFETHNGALRLAKR